jgi:hypothetical protein
MDYSAAQHGARANKYAEVMVSLVLSFKALSKKAQDAERSRYVQEAQDMLKGCATHFNSSVLRIKRNLALVPSEQTNIFQGLIYQLLSQDTTSSGFDKVAKEVETLFHRIKGWLKWWLHPANASMIFAAKCTMSEGVSDATPTTSNPIEHQFSPLHCAISTNQDLILGIKKLHLHMDELHNQYLAIKGM